ncbi:DUF6470 family protein [Paenibacillus sp. sgz500958]|uniref:DUF6470 family protein n=1 Tax=Paenibacillus sp. sgz500958 TaxID=3242475 RepID=UPI0036D3D237
MLQIRQTPAILGIDADPGSFSIRQPKAEMNIHTTPAQLNVRTFRPELNIDQSRAWEAYHGGNPLSMNKRIYSGIQQLFLQNIANKVQQGDRVAKFFKPGNTIAEVYGTDTEPRSFPETRGRASMDNVDIHFTTSEPQISYQPAEVNVEITSHRPEVEYTRGKLDIYMSQYASLQITPPEINLYM